MFLNKAPAINFGHLCSIDPSVWKQQRSPRALCVSGFPRDQFGSHGAAVPLAVRLLASHQGEPDPNPPYRVIPGFSLVGIVPDDAAVFPPLHSGAAPFSPNSPLTGSQDLDIPPADYHTTGRCKETPLITLPIFTIKSVLRVHSIPPQFSPDTTILTHSSLHSSDITYSRPFTPRTPRLLSSTFNFAFHTQPDGVRQRLLAVQLWLVLRVDTTGARVRFSECFNLGHGSLGQRHDVRGITCTNQHSPVLRHSAEELFVYSRLCSCPEHEAIENTEDVAYFFTHGYQFRFVITGRVSVRPLPTYGMFTNFAVSLIVPTLLGLKLEKQLRIDGPLKDPSYFSWQVPYRLSYLASHIAFSESRALPVATTQNEGRVADLQTGGCEFATQFLRGRSFSSHVAHTWTVNLPTSRSNLSSSNDWLAMKDRVSKLQSVRKIALSTITIRRGRICSRTLSPEDVDVRHVPDLVETCRLVDHAGLSSDDDDGGGGEEGGGRGDNDEAEEEEEEEKEEPLDQRWGRVQEEEVGEERAREEQDMGQRSSSFLRRSSRPKISLTWVLRGDPSATPAATVTAVPAPDNNNKGDVIEEKTAPAAADQGRGLESRRGWSKASVQQRRDVGTGETGDPRENPPTSGHRPARFPHPKTRERPGLGSNPVAPDVWKASNLTTTPPRPLKIWAALNIEILRADGGDWGEYGSAPEFWAGGGRSREGPPTSGIVRHDSHMRGSGVARPGIEPGSPWWKAGRLTAQIPRPLGGRGGGIPKVLACRTMVYGGVYHAHDSCDGIPHKLDPAHGACNVPNYECYGVAEEPQKSAPPKRTLSEPSLAVCGVGRERARHRRSRTPRRKPDKHKARFGYEIQDVDAFLSKVSVLAPLTPSYSPSTVTSHFRNPAQVILTLLYIPLSTRYRTSKPSSPRPAPWRRSLPSLVHPRSLHTLPKPCSTPGCMQERGKREIPGETRSPMASSDAVAMNENPGSEPAGNQT
ncbi:hypothetical protein PR048_026227 [Dryococelus australis]|uniref:Uncharacterized protein n=1 Tax=Dryococelus australis TaxID=614101 RepID=A0ABQ9GKT5_9NEOP|nr:hypothetical protein PR048_026227 [Dryococelus australis]